MVDKITHENAMRALPVRSRSPTGRRSSARSAALRAESPDVDIVTRVGRLADERDLATWKDITTRGIAKRR